MKKRVCIAVIGLIAMVAAAGCGKEKTEEVARIAETEAYAPQEETEPQEEAAGSEADADKEDAAEDDGEKASDEEACAVICAGFVRGCAARDFYICIQFCP